MVSLLERSDLETLTTLRDRSLHNSIVALLPNPPPSAFGQALAMGASSAIGKNASPSEIVQVLSAAFQEWCIVPIPVAQHIALHLSERDFKPHEVNWLVGLDMGRSVAELTNSSSYSVREMFRLLRRLYTKLGATSRTGALLKAKERGLI
jgi:DNA-binding NarL/FixJ family response regulator